MLAAVNAPARRLGIKPGQRLVDARVALPDLRLAPHDARADRHMLAALADVAERYTPWCALDGRDGLWLDITGCAHLFGGEAALLDDLRGRVERLGFAATLAAADSPGAAWALARYCGRPVSAIGGEAADDAVDAALAPLPVAALRLPVEVVEGLNRLGLRTIADLAAQPRAGLAARFGASLVTRLDQAFGRVDEPINPRRPVEAVAVERLFGEPIARPEHIEMAVESLAEALSRHLGEAELGARLVELALYRVDNRAVRTEIATSAASRDPGHFVRLLAEHLPRLDPGAGVEVMRLAAVRTDRLAPAQAMMAALAADRQRTAARSPADDAALAALVDRLAVRLGTGRVHGLAARASHRPERAVRATAPMEAQASPKPRPSGGPSAPRPLHLLTRPEPIEAMAPLPDDPPVMIRWRDQAHRITRADGPERIGGEWWRGDSGIDSLRDYYRVETTEGLRLWVYRAGLNSAEHPARWFLHGFFA